MLISDAVFCFLDIETTGLSPGTGGKICEIALIKKKGDDIFATYNQLVNPGCQIPENIIKIHGITNEMVSCEPKFEAVAPDVLALIDETVLVCHNAEFDVPFMAYEFYLAGLKMPEVEILDTLKFSRRHGNFESNKLGEVARALGYSSSGWHRAMNDTGMTERIFSHFLAKFQKRGAVTVEDLVKLQYSKKDECYEEK